MYSITITNPQDRSFPFCRTIFEDQHVLYHGTWSAWSSRIEAAGFVPGVLPFNWHHVATVFRANQAIGRGSFLRLFLGQKYPRDIPPCDLYLSANFWVARGYATNKGGEVIRKTIEEAEQFERICATPQQLVELKTRFKNALREHGPHALTQAAIETIENEKVLKQFRIEVKAARDALIRLTEVGHPIVYAIRVEPEWLGEYWSEHISGWEEGTREVNLRHCGGTIPPDRIVAKAIYPNGTDREFMPAQVSTWEDAIALSSDTSSLRY